MTEESCTWLTVYDNVFAGAFWTVGIPKMSFEASIRTENARWITIYFVQNFNTIAR